MTLLSICLALALAPLHAPDPDDAGTKATENDLVRFDGDWRITAIETGDFDLLPQLDAVPVFRMKSGKITFVTNGKVDMKTGKMSFALEPKKKPKAIDLTEEYPGGKRHVVKGIYEFGKGQVKIGLYVRDIIRGEDSTERPPSFRHIDAKKHGGAFIVVLFVRAKP